MNWFPNLFGGSSEEEEKEEVTFVGEGDTVEEAIADSRFNAFTHGITAVPDSYDYYCGLCGCFMPLSHFPH